jgi:hypothetical protein
LPFGRVDRGIQQVLKPFDVGVCRVREATHRRPPPRGYRPSCGRPWTSSADYDVLSVERFVEVYGGRTGNSVQDCSSRRDRDHGSIHTPMEAYEQYCSVDIGAKMTMLVLGGDH